MKNIVVTGSLAYDYIMDFPESFEDNIMPDKLKTLSVSFLAKNFSKNVGGTAGNIAYNLALLGQSPAILASWGEKDFGPYELHMRENDIPTDLINNVKDEFTANMFLITDKNNCQIAGFYPGAMSLDADLSLPKENADLVVIAPTVPDAMRNFVREAKKRKLPYLFTPSQQIPRLSKEDLVEGINGATIIVGNDYEISLIGKKTGLGIEDVLKGTDILITTLGRKGSKIQTKKETVNIGIAKADAVVDPTGAGDAYIAGFLSGFINEDPLEKCGKLAAVCASFAIEHYGTQKHSFKKKQFEDRYSAAFG